MFTNTLPDFAIFEITLFVALMFVVNFILIRRYGLKLNSKEVFASIALSIALSLTSLVFVRETSSGAGTLKSYGWPHTYYGTWKCFEWECPGGKEVLGSPNLLYYFSTLIFFSSIVFTFFTSRKLLKQGKRK